MNRLTKNVMSVLLAIGAMAVICLAGAANSFAQGTSAVTGVVMDRTGGVIAGVHVTLTNSKTGLVQETNTNGVGVYQFLLVPPGDGYSLTFTKDSFRTFVIQGQYLGVGVTETRDAHLEVGEATQRIEVNATSEGTLNTTDASIGNVIEAKTIQDLPIQFRMDASGLLGLQPGVQTTGGDAQFGSVTGARADQQNITVDGLDSTDETIGQPFTTIGHSPIDSVQEVRTIVGNADSTLGRSSSAQVDIITKSGTNDFHGSVREYNRNTDFEANGFFNNLAGVPRPVLIRNQFGGNLGGPIKKDKLFFFFDYDGLRQTAPAQVTQNVPVAAVRAGGINYINSGPGCTGAARLNTDPACITTLPNTSAIPGQQSVTGLDPAGIGADTALISFLNSRYPQPNFPSGGDGVNTEGFLFNAPAKLWENTYIGRVDYVLTSRQKLFARGTWDRDHGDQVTQQFPGDPESVVGFVSHNRSFVVGHTWEITNALLNDIYAGLTRNLYDFPSTYAPTSPNLFGFSSDLTSPYGDFRGQARNVGVPEVREQLTWTKGRHTSVFGGDFRFIREFSSLSNSVEFPVIGLGGNLLSLNTTGSQSVRPSDIYQTSTDLSAINEWDSFFPVVLGRYASSSANFTYDLAGNPLPIGSASIRHWNYNEIELFAQDTWRIRSDLTLLYGLRWVFHGVPYEENGYESVSNVTEQQLFGAREAAAAAGVNGNAAAPLVTQVLAGPGNKGSTLGYYRPDYKDFAPKIGIAYSPSFTKGLLGSVFGDRRTSIRAGAGIVYDRVLNTLEFELDQSNFLFFNNVPQNFGIAGDPVDSLINDPRFTSLNAPPPISASAIPRPFTPNVDANGNPIGLADFGGFPNFFNFNQNLRTPYAINASLGVQRELPGNFLLDINYLGRFGRRLVGIGDAAQQLNFMSAGQSLNAAFGNIEQALHNGVPIGSIPAQPWFENQVGNAATSNFGATCPQFFHGAGLNCTNVVAADVGNFVTVGDLSSTDLILSEQGLLLPNTGLDAQTGSAGYIGNYSSSNYNSLIITLRKRISYNLQFDFDYAYAHSIDNVSDINNDFVFFTNTGQGLVCDLRNLRECRASSDFDARHTISSNYVYTLPVGRGQRFLGNSSKVVDAILGGWGTSGIVTWRTGFPLNTSTGTFPINFTQNAPAVYVGSPGNVSVHVNSTTGGIQYFTSQANALNAFTYPFGGGTGTRNALRGPNYSNVDMGIFKNFAMPWSERQNLQFRADAFNVFNNVSWGNPATAINAPSTFGLITSQANSPRVLQVALRYSF
jgi:Carboxypeptidase regulatory-like domain